MARSLPVVAASLWVGVSQAEPQQHEPGTQAQLFATASGPGGAGRPGGPGIEE